MSRLTAICCTSLLLTACATAPGFYPSEIGVSNEEWSQYSEAQRQQALNEYNQSQQEREKMIPPGSRLAVSIQGGTIYNSAENSQRPYQPVSFTLKRGDCNEKITFIDADDSHRKSKLYVCYRGDTLYLDPGSFAPENPYGSVKFQYLPNWKRGFTYPNINTSGSAKLSSANLTVKELSTASAATN